MTTGASGSLIIFPYLSTTMLPGVTLGTSITQTTPVSSPSQAVVLEDEAGLHGDGLWWGTNSTMKGWGWFVSGGVAATANSGMTITFGGTSAAFDHSVNQSVWISKTLSVAGSWTTQYADLSAMN